MKTLTTPFRGKISHLTEDGEKTICGRPILPHWNTYLTEDHCSKCGDTYAYIAAAKKVGLSPLFYPLIVPEGMTIEQTASREISTNPLWTDQMILSVFDGKQTISKPVIEWITSFIIPEEDENID